MNKLFWLLMVLPLLVLAACSAGPKTIDISDVQTQIASTAMALQTQTALAMPTATETPQLSPTPETTLLPQGTQTPATGTPGGPTATPIVLSTLLATSQVSCDNMQYVADVTYQDGSVVYPGDLLIKTWTVKNLGPCTWNTNYALVWGWGTPGTNWNTIGRVNLTKNVLPGETVDISVSLTTPTVFGDYTGAFRMQNDKHFNFGTALTIVITVKK